MAAEGRDLNLVAVKAVITEISEVLLISVRPWEAGGLTWVLWQ
jgi:hypothetical protein